MGDDAGDRRRRRLVFYVKTIIEKAASYLMTGVTLTVDPSNESKAARERARKTDELLVQVARV